MFKKDLNQSFAQRVKGRIIQEINHHLPIYRKKLTLPIFKFGIASVLFSIITYISTLFFGKEHIIPTILFALSFASLLFTIFCCLYYLEKWAPIKRRVPFLNLTDLNAKLFINDDKFEQFLYLNADEIKELFTLRLTSEQLDYLQKIIVAKERISLDDFEYLPNILTEEEAILREQEREREKVLQDRHKLTQFLSEYNLDYNANGQEIIDRFEQKSLTVEQDKELSLSSKL